MLALLIQHGCEAALEVLPEDTEAQGKAELNKKAHSAVILCLGSKEIKEKSKAKGNDGEGLYVKGRTDRRDSRQSREVKKSTSYVKKDDQPSSSGSSFDDSKVMSAEALQDLIIDSGCSYHMTPKLDIFFDFLKCDEGSVLLGDNRECKIREGYTVKMQSSKVNVINGSMVVLSGTQMANCVYSLDGHVVACELNASVDEIDSLAHVWYKRLGHISEAGLHVLEKQGLFGKESLAMIESGNARHLTVVGMPQHNGLVERMNRTLIDKTPMEMWSGHPSDYTMLKIFGCVAYSYVKQDKLESRVVKYVLLGYPEGVKGYRLYRLDGKPPKIVTSRNVVFNESFMYKDMLKNSGAGDDKSVEELQVKVKLQSSKWKAAMKEEMDSLRKNKTWELVDPPIGQKLVSSKWLFKIKEGIECVQKHRYKASLVARGFTQRPGIVYNKVFSLVIRHTSIRVILALTACKDYELEQLDVKMAFLHKNLEEVIYMRRFNEYMLSNRFKRSSYDSGVYYNSYAPGEYIYLLLYVDDMLIAYKRKAEIVSTKSLLKKEFNMKELGEAKKILGMEIVRDQSRKIMRVSQSGYVSKILNNFRINNGKSVQMSLGRHFKLSLKDYPVRDCDVERMSKVLYANAVGSLMYLMVCTRPDVATRNFSISNLAVSVKYFEFL
nr:retrotransposon protein, putative, Ty1-copia subclass [Tanacetum cinerariifolium]